MAAYQVIFLVMVAGFLLSVGGLIWLVLAQRRAKDWVLRTKYDELDI